MTRAGADIIVAHMGVTTGGADRRHLRADRSTPASPRSTPSPPPAARPAPDVIVLCHGGPIADARRRRLYPEARPRLPRLLRRLLAWSACRSSGR